MQSNYLELSASIAAADTMHYTPAGVPALNLQLDHESTVQEAETPRSVNLSIKAVAFGAQAERLAKQAIGSSWKFQGFLGNARQGKAVIFHIQDFLQD